MSAPFVIRPVSADDFDAWKVLWDGYNAFYGRSGPTALPAETTATTWRRFFDGNEPMHAMVAEASGQLLGLVHYLFHRSTIDINPACYLQDLFTADAARGRGVGRALIGAACREARAAGTTRLYWHTRDTNTDAMRLYDKVAEKSGFIVYRMTL
jgi:GNAT superfamily N-acetyltransferase